ncbi:hypothetical protein AB0F17_08405 [Nonomuraea sp. NPDC026600]|uniref:hypothetical protein n=1 Tax=Nonomuraea sp. NPDC026600 TaxID=3155363 RepID=UPI0033F43751
MAIRIATASRNAAADAIAALASGGSVEIRTGTQPATAQDTATGTLLATVTLATPAYSGAATGVAALASTPRTATGVADGTAGWCRVKGSGGATVFDGSVTTTGGGGQLELATTTISTGLTINVTSGNLTMPGS